VSCGWRHTIAVTERENVYSWGRGANGQLGNGETRDRYKIESVQFIFLSIMLSIQTFIVLVVSGIRNVPTIIEAFSVDGSSGKYIETSKSCASSGALIYPSAI